MTQQALILDIEYGIGKSEAERQIKFAPEG